MPVFKHYHIPTKIMTSVLLATLLTTPALANAKHRHFHKTSKRITLVHHAKHHRRYNIKKHHIKHVRFSHKRHYTKRHVKVHHHKHKYYTTKHKKHHVKLHRSKKHYRKALKKQHRARHHKRASDSDTSIVDDNNDNDINSIANDYGNDSGFNDNEDTNPISDIPSVDTNPVNNGDKSNTSDNSSSTNMSGSGLSDNELSEESKREYGKVINQDRAKNGAQTVIHLPSLDAEAQQEAENSPDDSASGRTVKSTLDQNIGVASSPKRDAKFTELNRMSSNDYSSIVLNPYWNRFGVGCAGSNGHYSYVAIFKHVKPKYLKY